MDPKIKWCFRPSSHQWKTKTLKLVLKTLLTIRMIRVRLKLVIYRDKSILIRALLSNRALPVDLQAFATPEIQPSRVAKSFLLNLISK